MTDAERDEAINQVLDRAQELGLHGILILSPKCEECGGCHDFQVTTDLSKRESVIEILSHELGRIQRQEGYRYRREHKRKEGKTQ